MDRDQIIGLILSCLVMFVLGFLVGVPTVPSSAITYEQQHQDKELCERDIKRSERCVPVMMWLPEVTENVDKMP